MRPLRLLYPIVLSMRRWCRCDTGHWLRNGTPPTVYSWMQQRKRTCLPWNAPSESPRWDTNRSRHLTHVTLSGSRGTMVMPHNVITLFSEIAVLPIYPAKIVIANKVLQSFASLTNRSEGLTSLPSKWLLWRVHETPSSLGEISTKTSRVWLQNNPDGMAQAWIVCSMEQCVIGYLFLNKYGYCGFVQETHH